MAQPTAEQMTARAADIHGRNVAAGWWTDLQTGESLKGRRSPLELLALVHSELSEALEGDRKNLMDDKLPHRSMFEVELADAVIRAYDIAGGFDLDMTAEADDFLDEFLPEMERFPSRSESLALLHAIVSANIIAFVVNENTERQRAPYLVTLIHAIYAVAERFDLDLDGAIDEKLAFNAARADHKPENRKLAGGKIY